MGKLANLLFKEEREKEIRYILSIDGGGMRGIIPAYVISRLDELLKEKGIRRPLYSFFDLVAGTSTGALLALGLTAPGGTGNLIKEEAEPYPVYTTEKKGLFRRPESRFEGYIMPSTAPSSLLDIYLRHGERIFPKSVLSVFNQIFQQKYDIRPFETFLSEYLGDARLDSLLVPTLVVSYDPIRTRPFLFKSYESHGFLMREAARASTAAPLYFPPYHTKDRESGDELTLSDGGLVANNPAMIAYIEAKKLYPEADEFHILSLSTCKRAFSFDPGKTAGGAAPWLMNITKIYSNAQESLVSDEIRNMSDVSYLRIHSPISEKRIALDDTSKESIMTLLEGGKRAYDAKKDEIALFVDEMTGKKGFDNIRLSETSGSLPLISHNY